MLLRERCRQTNTDYALCGRCKTQEYRLTFPKSCSNRWQSWGEESACPGSRVSHLCHSTVFLHEGQSFLFTKTVAKHHQLQARQDQLLLTKAVIKIWDYFIIIRLGKHLWAKKEMSLQLVLNPYDQKSSVLVRKLGLSRVQILPCVVRWPPSS